MNVTRIHKSLFAFGISGAIGVLVDLDHLLCGVESGLPIWPFQNLYGCKIWHEYLPMVSAGLILVIVALGLGLILALVFNAIRSRSDHGVIKITYGVGVGQTRKVLKYDEILGRITFDGPFDPPPDKTSDYVIR